jgi:hypothetical protein
MVGRGKERRSSSAGCVICGGRPDGGGAMFRKDKYFENLLIVSCRWDECTKLAYVTILGNPESKGKSGER